MRSNVVPMPYLDQRLFRQSLSTIFTVLAGACIIALSAQISIPLPFTPVPLTGQTFAVMMMGALLGSRKGSAAVVTYLVMTMCGLPVLAAGFANPLAIIGPRGGYFVGMIVQAFMIGWYVERAQNLSSFKTLFVFLASSLIQLSFGALYLGLFVGYANALMMGFYPFVFGEIVKMSGVISYICRK